MELNVQHGDLSGNELVIAALHLIRADLGRYLSTCPGKVGDLEQVKYDIFISCSEQE